MKPLPRSFYNRPTLKVARDLLGKTLVREIDAMRLNGIITEVEAYIGQCDKASHASKGLTPRTRIMFGPPGYWYIYMIYGMYHCLNVVTERDGFPAAVLIRGVKTSIGGQVNGPGRVCRIFQIDRTLNATPADQNKLYIAHGVSVSPGQIKNNPRIGVDYAGEYKNKLWRFSFTADTPITPGAPS